MRVAVVGLGLIGGSVGLAAAGRGDEVVAFDPDPDAAAAGLETGAATGVADSLEDAVADAEIAVVCGPVARLPELVARTLDATGPGCAVSSTPATLISPSLASSRVNVSRDPPVSWLISI